MAHFLSFSYPRLFVDPGLQYGYRLLPAYLPEATAIGPNTVVDECDRHRPRNPLCIQYSFSFGDRGFSRGQGHFPLSGTTYAEPMHCPRNASYHLEVRIHPKALTVNYLLLHSHH